MPCSGSTAVNVVPCSKKMGQESITFRVGELGWNSERVWLHSKQIKLLLIAVSTMSLYCIHKLNICIDKATDETYIIFMPNLKDFFIS